MGIVTPNSWGLAVVSQTLIWMFQSPPWLDPPDPAGDYAAVLAMLLDDGAPPPVDTDALPDGLQAVLAQRPAP